MIKKTGAETQTLDLKYDTVEGKLILYFPPLKPNVNFDVNIQQDLSEDNIVDFISFAQAIKKREPDIVYKFELLQASLTDDAFHPARRTFGFTSSPSILQTVYIHLWIQFLQSPPMKANMGPLLVSHKKS